MADLGNRRKPTGVPRSPPRYFPPQAHERPGFSPAVATYGSAATSGRFGRERVNSRDSVNSTMSAPAGPPRSNGAAAANHKMGIKSGMTVEDLKRLTQQRIQQHAGQDPLMHRPAMGGAGPTPRSMPMNSVHTPAPAPAIPKTGMTVQELKELTQMRLRSQNAMQQNEVTGLVSKAVLSNAVQSQSQYRDPTTLRNSFSGTRPVIPVMRTSMRSSMVSPPRSMERIDHMPIRHSLPSRPPMFTPEEEMSFERASYAGPNDFLDNTQNSSSSDDANYSQESYDDDARSSNGETSSMKYSDDSSFPPPPPMNDHSDFAMPSWSPPPQRTKKLDGLAPSVHFYQPPAFDPPQNRDYQEVSQDEIIAPPPGLARRASMTVPAQVAMAVLMTPQTAANRKTLDSSTLKEVEKSAVFQNASRSSGTASDSASTEAFSRGRGGSNASATGANPTIQPVGARRGSFGNAAEFFRFRRRSKSRLELARDFTAVNAAAGDSGASGFPNYGATTSAPANVMPGIDERADYLDNVSLMNNAESSSNASNEGSDNEEVYKVDDPSQLNDYEDNGANGGAFGSFYNATGASALRGRGQLNNAFANLSILPPPPPPPMVDDEDDSPANSSKLGLPMMSPNGAKLRKVAELARRGSLSKEDKTRAKDEIIQSSLGLGPNATQAARMLNAKPSGAQPDRPPVSPSVPAPPPGFSRLGGSAAVNESANGSSASTALPAGIVRNTSGGNKPRPTASTPAASPAKEPTASSPSQLPAPGSLEERLAAAAQLVADCVRKGDMAGMQGAMVELDRLRTEGKLLQG